MSDEKHNNQSHSGYNLDELSAVPNEVQLDKNLAWEKLYSRLYTNNRRSIKSWHRIAAAAVLLALCFLGVNSLYKENKLVNTSVKNKWAADSADRRQRSQIVLQEKGNQKPSSRISGNSIHSLAGVAGQNSRQSFSKTGQFAKITDSRKRTIIKDIKKISGRQGLPLPDSGNMAGINVNSRQLLQPAEIHPKPDIVSDKLLIVNAKPAALKKTLRVVHVNELDEPAEATDNLAKNSGRHIFHLKWNEPVASPNNISGITYSHNDLVKISFYSPN